jgi:hypothetical protein
MGGMIRKYILNFLTTSMPVMSRYNDRGRLRKFAYFLTDLCWLLLPRMKGRYAKDVSVALLT